MEQVVQLSFKKATFSGQISLSGSKSISNRVLLIRALSGVAFNIANLSNSDDTVTMNQLLSERNEIYDAHHAGTTFRFLTAYFAFQEGEQILTGSQRMKQRPIAYLVDALKYLGADITYLEKEGYPPLKINAPKSQENSTVHIKGNLSSQYISALCMIAPTLSNGLEIIIEGDLVSEPYLLMTLQLMRQFGVTSSYRDNKISIPSQRYVPKDFIVEGDWSSASYLYGLVALVPGSKLKIINLFENSVQGDAALSEYFKSFGVRTKYNKGRLSIENFEVEQARFDCDLIGQPDIAQTFSALCATKGIPCKLEGLQTLAIKESDRIIAMQAELARLGVQIETNDEKNVLIQSGEINTTDYVEFKTYNDHRMAMALSLLATKRTILIKDPKVVNKSYPNFWNDLETLGFEVKW